MKVRALLPLFGAALFLQAQDARSLAEQAVAAQQQQRWTDAASAYTELLKLLPDDVTTHVNFGVVLVHLGRYSEAIEQYHAAEKTLPGDPRIELNIALAYSKAGQPEKAAELLAPLYHANPADNQILMLLASAYLDMGDYARVAEVLQPVADKQDANVAYLLGTAAYRSGNYPEAITRLTLAKSLPDAESMLSRALLLTADPEGALEAANAALKIADDPNASFVKAQILTARKRDGEALPLVQKLLALDPDNVDAELMMAELLNRQADDRQAQELAEKAVRARPDDEHAHRVLAEIYRKHRNSQAAEQQDQLADEIAAKLDPGPKVNTDAPDFALPDAVSGREVRLSSYRGKSPVAVVFGSYSCPNFRDSAETLKAFQERFGQRVPFLLVYVREAHGAGQWQSARNSRADLQVSAVSSMADKQQHASLCSRKLHLPFPALVDGMDGRVETEYGAWPSRAFLIDKQGRVAYSTRLDEMEFQPERMQAMLEKLSNE